MAGATTAGTHAPIVYVLEFERRVKIGVATEPEQRIKAIVWEHKKLAAEALRQIAITAPTPDARRVEAGALNTLKAQRLDGEYVATTFDFACGVVEQTWARILEQNTAIVPSRVNRSGGPRIYKVAHPRTPWRVHWLGGPVLSGPRPKYRKHFKDESEARTFLANITNQWRAQMLNEQTDAAEAVRMLRGHNVTLCELARDYLKTHRSKPSAASGSCLGIV